MLNNVKMGPAYTWRNLAHTRPFALLGCALPAMILVFGYMLRLAERAEQPVFDFYVNALWCITVTTTTVGK